jgi:teichuronic acid biosynthesis glycosyltransferase TuaG
MKSDKTTVDVVIPTFNSQEFLLEALNSCFIQTHPVNHVIIVDDGSSDSSLAYLKELETNFPKLKIILNHHTGLPGLSRQIGINSSNAEWIAFLDSDDYWAPEKIEKQIKSAELSNSGLVYSNGWKVKAGSPNEIFYDDFPEELSISGLLSTNWLINSSVIVKRELFTRKTVYATSSRLRAVEDYATWLRLATICNFRGVDEPLTYYRDHSGSIRSGDAADPRIHAIADFIEWAHACEPGEKRRMRKFIQKAIKSLKNQYSP